MPGSSVQGISQARILECVAITFSRDLSNPEIKSMSPALQADSLTTGATREANTDERAAFRGEIDQMDNT